MNEPTCSKRKYVFKVTVEIDDNDGKWGWPYLPKSDNEVKELVHDGIKFIEYGDVWLFKKVTVEEMPMDILNTPTIDIKTGMIGENDEI